MKISALDIAKVAHEVNRAYCAGVGDDSQVAWESAPQWQRDSALAGVTSVLHGAANSPEEQHAAWSAQKVADGWTYGETKDAEQKTQPVPRAVRRAPRRATREGLPLPRRGAVAGKLGTTCRLTARSMCGTVYQSNGL